MTVYLVGAGPGDPGLITVRGAELLADADVVVYDRLAAPELLGLAPAAEHLCVAKTPGRPGATQDEINRILVAHGRAGRTVVRLKGGDPFVFARGGEECLALAEAGVAFEVVPGVSSAVAAPAYAGIPVTLRHSSTSLTIVTGHEDPASPSTVDWRAIAAVGGTIVVLMGVARIRTIAEELIAGGLDPETPVAAVRWGTRPDQTTVRAVLSTIADENLGTPTTLVIGRVASDATSIGWFEQRPLFARSVVVTRPFTGDDRLTRGLRAAGARVVHLPVVAIEPIAPADRAGGGFSMVDHDWIVFTSANAVSHFMSTLRDSRSLGPVRVAAVGTATAGALADLGVVADLVASRQTGADLAAEMAALHDRPARAFVPRAEDASPDLVDGLRAAGWSVEVEAVYRTVRVEPPPEVVETAAGADVVTFASPSAVHAFASAVSSEQVPPVVATIGPTTTAAALEAGFAVDIEASVHSSEGLVDSLVEHFTAPGSR